MEVSLWLQRLGHKGTADSCLLSLLDHSFWVKLVAIVMRTFTYKEIHLAKN